MRPDEMRKNKLRMLRLRCVGGKNQQSVPALRYTQHPSNHPANFQYAIKDKNRKIDAIMIDLI